MCGIIGYVGSRDVTAVLIEGLKRLEYRGYDSAGIALAGRDQITVCKSEGVVRNLIVKTKGLSTENSAVAGIGHTRWATHGEPSDINAHPHCDAAYEVAVVHNGVLENASELRDSLERDGVVFKSDTDTECLSHMIAIGVRSGMTLRQSVVECLNSVVGTLGLAVVSKSEPGLIVAARRGSPLLVGIGSHGLSVASDVAALSGIASKAVFLEDDDVVSITQDKYEVVSVADSRKRYCREEDIEWEQHEVTTGDHAHFMIKEILEQPSSIKRALAGRLLRGLDDSVLGGFNLSKRDVTGLSSIRIIGCGSAMYAGMYGAGVIESLSGIPSSIESAGEFVTRGPEVMQNVLYVFVSQSGETADTLSAIRYVKERGGRTLSVVNVVGSAIARESDGVYLHAGPEISVASTKAFTSMQTCLLLIAIKLASLRDRSTGLPTLVDQMLNLPSMIQDSLSAPGSKEASAFLSNFSSAYYISQGVLLPVAYEGAQKMKEVSYIHAEAYPASELKHGPLALISANFPSVVLVPTGNLSQRVLTSANQIKARSGPLVGVLPRSLSREIKNSNVFDLLVDLPEVSDLIFPILATVPLQIMAYETSLILGRDIDRPRNLAKSVTVA